MADGSRFRFGAAHFVLQLVAPFHEVAPGFLVCFGVDPFLNGQEFGAQADEFFGGHELAEPGTEVTQGNLPAGVGQPVGKGGVFQVKGFVFQDGHDGFAEEFIEQVGVGAEGLVGFLFGFFEFAVFEKDDGPFQQEVGDARIVGEGFLEPFGIAQAAGIILELDKKSQGQVTQVPPVVILPEPSFLSRQGAPDNGYFFSDSFRLFRRHDTNGTSLPMNCRDKTKTDKELKAGEQTRPGNLCPLLTLICHIFFRNQTPPGPPGPGKGQGTRDLFISILP